MKIKAKVKDCHLFVRVKLPKTMTFSPMEMANFMQHGFRGFLVPKVTNKNALEYSGPVGVSLAERIKEPVSKADFFYIMEQIVDNTIKLQSASLMWNKVIWDANYTFINSATKEIQHLYLPVENFAEPNRTALQFILDLCYHMIPCGQTDVQYIARFLTFLQTLPSYHPANIERYIAQQDRNAVNMVKRKSTLGSGFMTDKPKDYYAHYQQQMHSAQNIPNTAPPVVSNVDEATGLLQETPNPLPMADESTGLLQETPNTLPMTDEPTGLLQETPNTLPMADEPTGLLQEENCERTEAPPTAYLGGQNQASVFQQAMAQPQSCPVHFATLYRNLTGETISINKPVFRLGKERQYVDYFIQNNPAVSRSHADIISRGNQYFVKDLNSKNHTYINGQTLPMLYEMEITDGDELKLGNEVFIFHI